MKLTILIVAAAMISIAISPTLLLTPVVKVLAAKGSSSSSNETSSSSTSVSSSGGFKKVQILDSQAFTYKCLDGKSVSAKGVNLDVTKTSSSSSWKGTWKITGVNSGVKSGSISSGKVLPKKGDTTPVSFSGSINTDTLCAQGLSAGLKTMQISTYCFGDEDVRVTFKEGSNVNSGAFAHVECT